MDLQELLASIEGGELPRESSSSVEMPPIPLNELVDQLECGEREEHLGGFGQLPPLPSLSPTEDGRLAAESLWEVLQNAELTGLRDLFIFTGIRAELPQLLREKVTVLAPTNQAQALTPGL